VWAVERKTPSSPPRSHQSLMAETVAGVLAILLIVSILLYVYLTVR
jgi:hypothetical protein